MLVVKSGKSTPRHLLRDRSLYEDVQEHYHGTSPFSLLGICEEGFRVSLGAGADALEEHYGSPVPGCYVSKSWQVAMHYPLAKSTLPQPEDRSGLPGGSLVALDGTHPLRCIVRCLARTSMNLWSKGSNQSAYRPCDLHVTHLCFYAVAARLTSCFSLGCHAVRMNADIGCSLEEISDHNQLLASNIIADSVVSSRDQALEYPVTCLYRCKQGGGPDRSCEKAYEAKALLGSWLQSRRPLIRVGTCQSSTCRSFRRYQQTTVLLSK